MYILALGIFPRALTITLFCYLIATDYSLASTFCVCLIEKKVLKYKCELSSVHTLHSMQAEWNKVLKRNDLEKVGWIAWEALCTAEHVLTAGNSIYVLWANKPATANAMVTGQTLHANTPK